MVEYSKKHPRDSTRVIAEVFNCGRTQIQQILKNKDRIVLEFEAKGEPATRKRKRKAAFQSVNDAVYQWYRLVRQRNVPVSGPMLQTEARLIADKLQQPSFKASNGWLQSFKNHFGLKQLTISGEAADVPQETIEGWFERLKVLMQGYELENIWNEDETGCFFKALPDKTLAEKRKECRGGKRSK